MAEPVEAWWRRRQFSRGLDVPYPVGSYREAWAAYPMLVRQYHPQFNAGITLSQIPPAADVLLVWECDVGHLFAATPTEQRQRPGRVRRRSSWCPECAELARPRTVLAPGAPRRERPRMQLCEVTPDLPPGTSFTSACAPRATSAAEQELRARLLERLDVAAGHDAVRVRRPFFEHLEVWPDIVLPELRIGPHDVEATGVNRRTIAALVEEFRTIRGALLVDASLRG